MNNFRVFRTCLIVAAVAALPAAAGAAELELVSRTDIAVLHGANGDSWSANRVSPDGRYALFASTAANLVDGDTNRSTDLFIADAQNGTLERVNLGQNGVQADDETMSTADMSDDGRYVVFQSLARNLVASPANGQPQIYMRDRQLQTTTLISRTASGAASPSGSYAPKISADGRHVVYSSSDSLVAADDNDRTDVYHYDRVTGVNSLVSVSAQGQIGNGYSTLPQISADGRYVVFRTTANNLFPGDSNSADDLVLRDLATGVNVVASVKPDGSLFGGSRYLALGNAISADGRYVLFLTSQALEPGDSNAAMDGFRFDRLSGTSERVTRGTGGSLLVKGATARAISADGSTLVMDSTEDNLVPGLTGGYYHSYARRIADGNLTLLKIRAGAARYNEQVQSCNLSGDAAVAYCTSRDRDIAVRNGADFSNLFRIPVGADAGVQVSLPREVPLAAANVESGWSSVSSDGRYVAFQSIASNLVADDTNGVTDVFLRDRVAGTTRRISVTAAGTQSDCASTSPQITADARYVVFGSCGALVAPASGSLPQVYRYDRLSETVQLVSTNAAGQPCNSSCPGATVSDDGSVIAFHSSATNLVAEPLPAAGGLFVRTLPGGTPVLVNRSFQGDRADGAAGTGFVTGDGRFVFYKDSSTNLVPGDSNGVADIFAFDRLAGTTQRVSLDNAGQQLSVESELRDVSHDGGTLLAQNISGGFVCAEWGFYVRDLSSGQSECVATSGNSARLSRDGRRVFFTDWYSPNPNVQFQEHAYVYDRDTGLRFRVTPANTNRSVRLLGSCASGRCLLLASNASNLTDDDLNNHIGDVFIVSDLVGDRIFRSRFQSND